MKIIGHRGCAGLEPENTLRSFWRALEIGADEIELDVQQSQDGQLMVIHDDKVDRTTNGRGLVKNLTAKQLRRLNAGEDEVIPYLDEVLVYSGTFANVEIKNPGCEKAMVESIRAFRAQKRVLVISFFPEVIRRIRKLDPKIPVGLGLRRRWLNPAKIHKQLGISRIFLKHTLASRQTVAEFHNLGVQVMVWTVDNPKDIKRMIKLGVDGICSNYPDRVKEILGV